MPLTLHSPAHSPFRFHVEQLLIIVAVVTVVLSLFFKAQVSRKFDALDDDFVRLQQRLSGENFIGGGTNDELFSELTAQCAPYTHFAPSLAQPLSELTARLVGTETPDTTDKADALSAVLSAQAFQNTLHAQQRKISAGFDSLLVCAAVLLAVAVSLIVSACGVSVGSLAVVPSVVCCVPSEAVVSVVPACCPRPLARPTPSSSRRMLPAPPRSSSPPCSR